MQKHERNWALLLPKGQQILFWSQLISSWFLNIFNTRALGWPQDQISLCGAFLPVYFSVCFVSVCFFPKMNILYTINKSPTCVTPEYEENVPCTFFFVWLKKEERKLTVSSTNFKGRRLTFEKKNVLLRCPSRSRCRFHQGLIFWNSLCLLSALLMGLFLQLINIYTCVRAEVTSL